MHHQTCSLTTWHSLSLSSSHIIHWVPSQFECVSWQELFLLTWEICLISENNNCMHIVSSSLMRVVFNGWLFRAAFKDNSSCWTIMVDGEIGIRFRYFSIILFQAAMLFGEGMNLLEGHDALVQAHYLLWHHLHDLPDEIGNAGCPIMLCMGLHMADSFSYTLKP